MLYPIELGVLLVDPAAEERWDRWCDTAVCLSVRGLWQIEIQIASASRRSFFDFFHSRA